MGHSQPADCFVRTPRRHIYRAGSFTALAHFKMPLSVTVAFTGTPEVYLQH